jgi:alkaline phosphatase D
MDGVRYDYPDYIEGDGFDLIARNGSKAASMIPVYQSSTYPGHVTMATGVTPDVHGILHNSFFDKKRGKFSYSADASWIESEPVWSIVENSGIKTATFFWVGSESDWNESKISYSTAPFDGKISESRKSKKILEWLDLEPENRPRLIMTWWHGSDSISHKTGALNDQVLNQLQKQNRELQKLIDAITERNLWKNITLMVVSDHGMSDVSNYINLKEILRDNSIESRIAAGPAVAHIFLEQLEDSKLAISALSKNKDLTVWTKKTLPKEFNMLHKTRTGDIIVTTRAPNMLVTRNSSNPPKGMHGYDPKHNKEMEGIFFAVGNKVSNKNIDTVHHLDITPTILDLLNLKVPEYMQGKVIQLD